MRWFYRRGAHYWQAILLFFLLCIPLSLSLASPVAHADGFPIIGVLHAGNRPEGMAVDQRTHAVYIAYEGSGSVVRFDPVSGKIVWQTSLHAAATDIQIDSQHQRVFVVGPSYEQRQGLLQILDAASGKILQTAPIGQGDNSVAIDLRRQRVYVAATDSGLINVFQLSNRADGTFTMTTDTLYIGTHPSALGINSRLGRLYVGDRDNRILTVYDEDKGKILDIIDIGNIPLSPIRVDENTGRVYVICSDTQELDIIDGKSDNVIAHIPVSPFPEGIDVSTATNRIYVADEGNNEAVHSEADIGTTITVIDGDTLDVIGTLKVGRAPDGIVVDPQLRRVYVAVEESNAVVEISDSTDLPLVPDTATRQTVAIERANSVLQRATLITLILMGVTVVGALLGALLPRWRGQESPQSQPDDVSPRSPLHTPVL